MNKVAAILTILISLSLGSISAEDCCDSECSDIECWRSVWSFECGPMLTSNAGKSKTFPVNPTDEFFRYSPNHKNQVRAMFCGSMGWELSGLCDWNIRLDLKYGQSSPFAVNGRLTQGLDVQSQDIYSYRYKISIRQLMVEARVYYENCTRFKPYGVVGMGASFNKAYSFATTVPELLTFTRIYKSKVTTGFTYAVGLGVDIEIVNSFYAGMSYRFTDFGRAALGTSSIDGIAVPGTLSQSNFYANQFFIQLTFLF